MTSYQPLHINLEEETNDNTYYRRVIYTLPNFQLVLMSLIPGQEIGMEVHPQNTQFIRVESGDGSAIINGNCHLLYDGVAVCIPPGAPHNIVNTSHNKCLKLYTIYVPPDHPDNLVEIYKRE